MILTFLLKFGITRTQECVSPFRYTLRQTSCHPEFSTSNIIQHRTRISIRKNMIDSFIVYSQDVYNTFQLFHITYIIFHRSLIKFVLQLFVNVNIFMGLDLIDFIFLFLSQLDSMLIFWLKILL